MNICRESLLQWLSVFWCTEITAHIIGTLNPIYTREVTEMALILLVMVGTLRLGMDAIDIQEGRV